jgi:transposase-like protein
MEELKFHKTQGGGERKNPQPYDYDLKIKIIQEYLTGGISYKALGEKYQINERLIHYWVHRYNGKRRPPTTASLAIA